MIDRKAFWISILLVLTMIAATLWRISLLPDWLQVPAEGPDTPGTISLLRLFTPPLCVLFLIGLLFIRSWLRPGPVESVRPWRRHNGIALLFVSGIMTLAQAFNLARSLGALESIDRLTLGRVLFVVAGIFMMVAGNSLPKLPRLAARFRPLDPWQWNQHLRFAGKVTVALGLFYAIVMPLLPIQMAVPVSLGVAAMAMAVGLWHRAKVRREPSSRS